MSIVQGGNPLGEGHFELQIEYTKNTSPLASAVKIVTEAKAGVHILCSRKSEAEAIHEALKDKEFKPYTWSNYKPSNTIQKYHWGMRIQKKT